MIDPQLNRLAGPMRGIVLGSVGLIRMHLNYDGGGNIQWRSHYYVGLLGSAIQLRTGLSRARHAILFQYCCKACRIHLRCAHSELARHRFATTASAAPASYAAAKPSGAPGTSTAHRSGKNRVASSEKSSRLPVTVEVAPFPFSPGHLPSLAVAVSHQAHSAHKSTVYLSGL